jgi:anti-anti-sigma factor
MEKVHILVVDDDDDACSELSIFLSQKGYNVASANSASDAMRQFITLKPDVVITDYMMPGETGLDLLKKIKAKDRSVIVIFMSGVADLKTAAAAMKNDAFDFLKKPIDLDELEMVIQQAINRTSREISVKPDKSESLITIEEVTGKNKVSIIYLKTKLDEETDGKYKTEFINKIHDKVLNHNVVIDLEHVKYINNIGLNLLVYMTDMLKAQNYNFNVCNLSNYVSNYIISLDHSRILNVVKTQGDAIAGLKTGH